MKKLLSLLIIIAFFFSACAQEESDYAELAFGAGIGNSGLCYGVSLDMTLFNILAGVRATRSGEVFGIGKQQIREIGFFAGYGHQKEWYSLGFGAGYAMTNYKCFNSSSNGCYGYTGGSYWGPTGHGRMTIRLSERTGLGAMGFINLNKRSDLYSVLVTLALSI